MARAAIGLQLETVTRRPLPLTIETTGKVESIPLREFIQHAPLAGRITNVRVDLGDNVSAGEVMATVDSPEINQLAAATVQNKSDLESEISGAESQYGAEIDQARVQVNLWEGSVKREKRLFEEGILAQKALLESQAQYKLAKSKLEAVIQKKDISVHALKVKLKVSQDSLSSRLRQLGVSDREIDAAIANQRTILSVPIRCIRSGVVTDTQAFVGEGIDSKDPLFRISDLREVWVTGDAYEDDMARMKVGQLATVKVAALSDKSFRGKLVYIGREVSSETRTLPVRLQIDNQEIKLKPGMFASVHIETSDPTLAIIVPREAVVDRTGHHIVFLETKGGYQACRVKVGRSLGDNLEITQGLQTGQRVVVRGAFQLAAEMLKSHGGIELFDQPTQGDHLAMEDAEQDAIERNRLYSYQALALAVLAAFVLGFAISAIFQRSAKQNKSKESGHSSAADSERIRRG
jgi:cobalt-zinc-cadmium efflux system membrane fusion protein